MTDRSYVVRPGDSLWSIAQRELGNPLMWSALYAHNNLPEVSRATGSVIADPDLIFVGQKLSIPGRPTVPRSRPQPNARPQGANPRGSGRGKARNKVHSPSLQYDLSQLPAIRRDLMAYVVEVKLSGNFTLRSGRLLDFVTISNQAVQVSAKRESETILQKFVNETKVTYEPTTGALTFENGITLYSKHGYVPDFGLSTVISTGGLPAIRATSKCPSVEGMIGDNVYIARDFGIEITLTPRPRVQPQRPSPNPLPTPVAQQAPSPQALPSGPSTWDYVVAGSLITGAAVLLFATLVEDVVTFGTGTADDVPSFLAASGMVATATAMVTIVPPAQPMQIEGAIVDAL